MASPGARCANRGAFTVLGDGERVGRIASGIGRDAELTALANLSEQEGRFAIHNDMTNCLRHGDLTAIREADGEVEVNRSSCPEATRPPAQVGRRFTDKAEHCRSHLLCGRGTRGAVACRSAVRRLPHRPRGGRPRSHRSRGQRTRKARPTFAGTRAQGDLPARAGPAGQRELAGALPRLFERCC